LFICFGPPFLVGHLISYSNFCLNVSNNPYMMHLHIPITINDTCFILVFMNVDFIILCECKNSKWWIFNNTTFNVKNTCNLLILLSNISIILKIFFVEHWLSLLTKIIAFVFNFRTMVNIHVIFLKINKLHTYCE
jgi:hypothetical protein